MIFEDFSDKIGLKQSLPEMAILPDSKSSMLWYL